MKLPFTTSELLQLAQLKTRAAKLRLVSKEAAVGEANATKLASAEAAARATVEGWSPSQLIAWSPEVEAAFVELRKAELIRTHVTAATRRFASLRSELSAELRSAIGNFVAELKYRLVRANHGAVTPRSEQVETTYGRVSPACLKDLERVSAIDRDSCDVADRADTLLAIAAEFGAEIPLAVQE